LTRDFFANLNTSPYSASTAVTFTAQSSPAAYKAIRLNFNTTGFSVANDSDLSLEVWRAKANAKYNDALYNLGTYSDDSAKEKEVFAKVTTTDIVPTANNYWDDTSALDLGTVYLYRIVVKNTAGTALKNSNANPVRSAVPSTPIQATAGNGAAIFDSGTGITKFGTSLVTTTPNNFAYEFTNESFAERETSTLFTGAELWTSTSTDPNATGSDEYGQWTAPVLAPAGFIKYTKDALKDNTVGTPQDASNPDKFYFTLSDVSSAPTPSTETLYYFKDNDGNKKGWSVKTNGTTWTISAYVDLTPGGTPLATYGDDNQAAPTAGW
jgi:hypothetical protein